MMKLLCLVCLVTILGVSGGVPLRAFTVGHASHIEVHDTFTVPFEKDITIHDVHIKNGVFTCPESGLYELQVYALTKSSTKLFMDLYQNDVLKFTLYAHALNGYASSGNAAILFLNANDTVQVKTRGNYDTATWGSADQIYTTLTGVHLGAYANSKYDLLDGFTAVLMNNQSVAGGATVIYDTMATSIPDNLKNNYQGNNYDHSTGVYTAPNGGIYVFHVFSLARRDQEVWQELYHNDLYVFSLYGVPDTNDWVDAGNTVILHLKKGDTIQVRAHSNTTNILYGSTDQIYSTFSGYELVVDDVIDTNDMGPIAYFSAGLSQEQTFQHGEKIIFDQVFTDHGTTNHYDHIHGEFTAPYSGLYQFNFHAAGQKNHTIWLELHHNYKYIDSLYSEIPNGYASGGNAAVLEMDAGDVVFVRARNENALFGSPSEIYCTFSGVMLHSESAHGGTGIVGK